MKPRILTFTEVDNNLFPSASALGGSNGLFLALLLSVSCEFFLYCCKLLFVPKQKMVEEANIKQIKATCLIIAFMFSLLILL